MAPARCSPGPYAAIAAVAVPGVFLTVVVACVYVTTDSLTPAGRTSEAYAWLILSIGAGQSVGTALAGRLAEQPLTTAALPAAGAAFALVVLLAARRRLGPTGCLNRRGRHAARPEAGTRRPDPGHPISNRFEEIFLWLSVRSGLLSTRAPIR
ncbi:hypothetical protein [Streptomyces sp. C8S0]|uniref:hypothetical protein n=1 Tax=Streptomyces sp. C8S0 TaxID=2585716 RepID=UPI00125CF46F|nr:hypothetical protein [Streptomyces sp. C8S0]